MSKLIKEKASIYYVEANDGRTDTTVTATSISQVKKMMSVNPWWKKYKLVPKTIRKMGEVE